METPVTSFDALRGGVIITGASTGIGRACTLSLDALGFRVFASVRKSNDGESLRRAASGRLPTIFIDITDEDSIAAAAEKVSQEVGDGGLVGLVNNAGIAIPGPLEYLPLVELRRQIEINLVAQLAVTSQKIIHALTARTPRTRYPAGAHARRLLTLYRLLPDRLFDRVIFRFFDLPRVRRTRSLGGRGQHGFLKEI